VRYLRASLAVASFALAATLTPAAFAQSDAEKAAARQLATQGGQSLAANKYAEALDLVTRAESMYHAPTHVSMIAKAQAGLGHYVAAREAYIKLSREELAPNAPAAFKAAIDDAKIQLPIVEAKIANLRIVIRGGEGKKLAVKIDDKPVPDAIVGVYAPVDPGKHDVSVSTGGAPVHASIELGPGDKKDVALDAPPGGESVAVGPDGQRTFAPEEQPPGGFFTPMRIAGVVVGGVGAAGVAVGVIFLAGHFSSKSAGDTLFNQCNPRGCTPTEHQTVGKDDTDAAHKGTIAAIALPAGGVALAAGVTLIVLGKPSGAPQPTGSVRVSPYFTGTGAGLAGRF
jgi:hypothetical protein